MTGLLADVGVRRGAFQLDLQVAVAPGEVVALVGPNGAGKSTALRVLAGLLRPGSGRVALDGRVLDDGATHVPSHRRSVGLVFQDYLLFPHLSLLDNVAFGPSAQGTGRAEARRRATGWLQRVGLAELAGSRPRAISGGQAQRVALARALATDPALLLLDEPLAALDARTRLAVRTDLRHHLTAFPGATLLVTHDPVDAAVLADRLVVLEAGRVVQDGPPAAVAAHPRTDYVAQLVGLNLLSGDGAGSVVRLPGGGEVHRSDTATGAAFVAFRPSSVSLFLSRPTGSPRNVWLGRVAGLEPHGNGVRVVVAGAPDAGSTILAEVTPAAVADLGLAPGVGVWAAVKASDVTSYDR